MHSAIFLSVRNKATRLPGKVLLDLAGRTVTERLIERLKLARKPERIVMCTSPHPDDDVLVEIAHQCSIDVFRGSEEDKLDRYLQAAKRFEVDFAAVVDGDDPFCDPGYIDRILRRAEETSADYVISEGLPLGVTAFGVRRTALERVCRIKTEENTEVWGGYFSQTGLFKTETVASDPKHQAPGLRMTLDYPADYAFCQRIYEELYRSDRVISLDEILGLVRKQPEIGEINRQAQAYYEENIERITRIGVKEVEA